MPQPLPPKTLQLQTFVVWIIQTHGSHLLCSVILWKCATARFWRLSLLNSVEAKKNVSFLEKSSSKANVEINSWRQANTEPTRLSVIAEYIRKIRGLLWSSVRSGQVLMLPAFFARLQNHQCGCWVCTSYDVRGGNWCIPLPNPSRKKKLSKGAENRELSRPFTSFLKFCVINIITPRCKYVLQKKKNEVDPVLNFESINSLK